ncbi:MAG: CBS domain-containing protein [Dyella sp.]|uniref:CBS domain-containing protein n=1 Tax=Dyella sp. TaxID=1869338 RepID=UPI003F7DCFD1
MTKTARDIMSEAPRSCSPGDNLAAVARMMRDDDIGDVPVIDDQSRLVGMITDRDIVVRCVAAGDTPRDILVRDCMTAPALWLERDASLEEVANLMIAQRVRRVPITDGDNVLCGIVSLADMEHSNARQLRDSISRSVATPH